MRTLPYVLAASLALTAACKDPASNAPRATTSSPSTVPSAGSTGATTPAPAGSERLTFGPPGSSVAFRGAKVTGSHDGSFQRFTGTIDLVPDHPERSRVSLDIEMASVTTDAERLTRHLQTGDFFDVPTHPRATFTSTSIQPGGSGGATHTVTGDLTLRGQTRAVTFPATIAVTPGEVTARAEFSINRRDWGIVYAGMPDNLIRDDVLIRLSLRAPRSGH